MMRDRDERLARNEALFRTTNERMAAWEENEPKEAVEHYACECANLGCRQRIALRTDEYESVRKHATRFFVVPGHEVPEVERVVEKHEGWVVIEKNPEAHDVSVETDPRSAPDSSDPG